MKYFVYITDHTRIRVHYKYVRCHTGDTILLLSILRLFVYTSSTHDTTAAVRTLVVGSGLGSSVRQAVWPLQKMYAQSRGRCCQMLIVFLCFVLLTWLRLSLLYLYLLPLRSWWVELLIGLLLNVIIRVVQVCTSHSYPAVQEHSAISAAVHTTRYSVLRTVI